MRCLVIAATEALRFYFDSLVQLSLTSGDLCLQRSDNSLILLGVLGLFIGGASVCERDHCHVKSLTRAINTGR